MIAFIECKNELIARYKRPNILGQNKRRDRQKKHTLISLGVMGKFCIITLMVMLQVYKVFTFVELHILKTQYIHTY